MPGTVWVTRRPGEEYLEDCLVPKFPRLTTVMVWGAIYRDLKGPLVIWDGSGLMGQLTLIRLFYLIFILGILLSMKPAPLTRVIYTSNGMVLQPTGQSMP